MTRIPFGKQGSVRSKQASTAEAIGRGRESATVLDIESGGDVLVPRFDGTPLRESAG